MKEKIPWWLADFFEWIERLLKVDTQGLPLDPKPSVSDSMRSREGEKNG